MREPSSLDARGWSRTVLLAIACAAFLVTVSMGIRQSFGLFMQPVGDAFGVGREFFGFAIALQNLLFGVAQPFVGAIADRYGTRRVVVAGGVVYAAGLVLAALAQSSSQVMAALGFLIGLGLSGTTFVVLMAAIGRWVRPEQRSLAFGLVTAGGSFGQFAVVPLAQGLIATLGWRSGMLGLFALMLVSLLAVLGLKGDASASGESAAQSREPLSAALRRAAGSRHYWLLNFGFFVCGFHIAFIATHFPAYLVDQGVAAGVGALALGLVGLFNIAGSYLFGIWGGRHSRPWLLAILYAARALAIAVFLLVPLSATSALVFAAVFGFLWLGTVPLTSGAVASMFGLRYLSTLYGVVFLSHQVGSFLGAWLAGRLFDATGSYDAVWLTSIVLGLFAAAVSALTRDAPVPLRTTQAAIA
ncbi:MAG: MFS transporter [Chiayiivirga sp.]|jgi:MFS family permease|uniref:MFS transporter n=1 Tax=Chiayiivirga sp. TaxID=2041042 RepID=UPI0025C5F62A|nr:MFS transporter [Chiayiivirga sp.]MCI1711648.1 MFS transporter [Chiayiivirga sp.]MCI1729777.1 MFS transporter [Chiayiivirga sp.]